MPWDPQSETIAISVSAAAAKVVGKTYRTEVEKFPLAYYKVTEDIPDAKTYTVGWEYSVDGTNWVALRDISGKR